MDEDNKPNAGTKSSAYEAMEALWQTIDDIIAGPDVIRKAKARYLPIHEAEKTSDGLAYTGTTYVGEYERRLAQAPWRPEFVDILTTLASKPFGKDVTLKDAASPAIKALAEDVDARGNSLTAFSRTVFYGGIAKGLHAILVDFPTMSGVTNLTDERKAGGPYWVSIRAENILALYTTFVAGKEVISHVRIRECQVMRDGFGEVEIERVRVLEPTLWQLWRQEKDADGKVVYVLEDEGPLTLGEVPMVLFWTGEREGAHFVRPPLRALADMQIELYRALSRQEEILTYTGSPMLTAQGIAAPQKGAPSIQIGPKRVLFAPPGVDGKTTGWAYIQPNAANLSEIRQSVDTVTEQMRRLGMQPMAPKTRVVTATAATIEASKAHSAVQAWAWALKDVLEQALVFTGMWLGETSFASVDVNTDFGVEPYAQAPLDALTRGRAAKDISQRTYWDALRRFSVLSDDFDPDLEEKQLGEELQGLQPPGPVDPLTGRPLDPAALPPTAMIEQTTAKAA